MEACWTPVLCFIGMILIYFFGTTGIWVRKGVNTKKALQEIKMQLNAKNMTVNHKWHSLNQKATLYIWGPICGWTLGYCGLFNFLPSNLFLISLAILVIPVLGYFGLRFGPDLEGTAENATENYFD